MASGFGSRRQITGTSDISVDDAIARALTVARETLREPDWFDVLTARGFISNGRVTHYQVTLDLGYESGQPDASGEDGYFQSALGVRRQADVQHTIELRF